MGRYTDPVSSLPIYVLCGRGIRGSGRGGEVVGGGGVRGRHYVTGSKVKSNITYQFTSWRNHPPC